MRVARAVLLAGGLVLGVIGAKYLYDSGFDNLLQAAYWLVGGVALHDAVLAPVTLLVVVVAARLLPDWLRGPVAVGFVVLGTVTIVAIPVLGRFGAHSDNPTLLDRNYSAGWLVLAALVVAGVAVGAWRRHARGAGVETPA